MALPHVPLDEDLPLGPLMVDLHGQGLDNDERQILEHPLVGGIILFARNYQNKSQLIELIQQIRSTRENLLIAVDHEGGRVQRFKNEFTRLPPIADFGKEYESNPQQAIRNSEQFGFIMASELLEVGIDFSFAPVLDVEQGISQVIGDRSFAHDPEVVTILAQAYIKGMRIAGMAAVGKHFPGHGGVTADSHLASPIDTRDYGQIYQFDMIPFIRLINELSAIMPSHVIYQTVDELPACFSPIWLQDILRRQLHFHGAVISDDMSMAGAQVIGDYVTRAKQALRAGCDMIILANNRAGVIEVLDRIDYEPAPILQHRLQALRAGHVTNNITL